MLGLLKGLVKIVLSPLKLAKGTGSVLLTPIKPGAVKMTQAAKAASVAAEKASVVALKSGSAASQAEAAKLIVQAKNLKASIGTWGAVKAGAFNTVSTVVGAGAIGGAVIGGAALMDKTSELPKFGNFTPKVEMVQKPSQGNPGPQPQAASRTANPEELIIRDHAPEVKAENKIEFPAPRKDTENVMFPEYAAAIDPSLMGEAPKAPKSKTLDELLKEFADNHAALAQTDPNDKNKMSNFEDNREKIINSIATIAIPQGSKKADTEVMNYIDGKKKEFGEASIKDLHETLKTIEKQRAAAEDTLLNPLSQPFGMGAAGPTIGSEPSIIKPE